MLAEITSQDENDFVESLIPLDCKYIQNSNVATTSPHVEEQDKLSSEVEVLFILSIHV